VCSSDGVGELNHAVPKHWSHRVRCDVHPGQR